MPTLSRGEELLRRLHEGLKLVPGGQPAPTRPLSHYEVYMQRAQDRQAHQERHRGETGDQR